MEPLKRFSAVVIYAFLAMHMANNYAGLMGVETYNELMRTMRLIYRHPIVECVLFLAFVIQVITGITAVRETLAQKKDWVQRLRVLSGVVIVAFVMIHIIHMAFGRMVEHTDTNFYYVAAGFMVPPQSYIMIAVYGAGLIFLFLYLGCVGYDLLAKVNKPVGYITLILVLILGGASTFYILQMLRGELYPLDVPETYTHVLKPEAGS